MQFPFDLASFLLRDSKIRPKKNYVGASRYNLRHPTWTPKHVQLQLFGLLWKISGQDFNNSWSPGSDLLAMGCEVQAGLVEPKFPGS